MAPQPGPVWHRARRRQDQAACGGGPPCGRASLDRGCARRPCRSQVGTKKRCADRTKKLALDAMPDRPPAPIGKRDSHDCRRGENMLKLRLGAGPDDPGRTPSAPPRPAPSEQAHAGDAVGATHPTATPALGGGGGGADRAPGRIPRLARQSTGEPGKLEAGREAEHYRRVRSRGAASDRPAARLRPRLTQEVHHRLHPNAMVNC